MSSDELPIITSKVPGSTTLFRFLSRKESASGPRTNSTVLVSPGLSEIRWKPLSSRMGRLTLETVSRR